METTGHPAMSVSLMLWDMQAVFRGTTTVTDLGIPPKALYAG